MAVHVVYVRPMQIVDGQVINKESATINQMSNASMEMRVIADPDVPNSAGHPTIKDYLVAEDGSGFSVSHIDNTMIITSS